MWLKYKLAEYDAPDAQQEDTRGPEPWELRADQAAMDYVPTDKDVDDLREAMAGTRFANEDEGKGLERRNVAEIDHPWHQYMEWNKCYSGLCRIHHHDKEKNRHFPQNQIPVYYSWLEMKEITRRRRSTGQLHLQGESPTEETQVWETYPHLLNGRPKWEGSASPGPSSDDESKN